MKFEKESDYFFYKPFLFYKSFFILYISFLFFINIQILKTKFEIRDI